MKQEYRSARYGRRWDLAFLLWLGRLYPTNIFDHARAVKDLLKAGVDCYMHWQTADVLGVSNHHRVHTLDNYRTPQIKGWSVLTFPLEHDVPTLGFFIERFEEGLLFIPDTCFIRNRFKRVNIIAIECNHISEILSEHIQGGNIPAVVGRRIRHNHMSLETVIKTLRANDLSKCRHIYLLHLSDANSDEAKMIKAVQEATGIPTSAC